MKTTKILMLLAIISFKSYGQDSLAVKKDSLKTQIFSLSPIYKKVDKVNGFVLGFGHYENCNIKNQKINGLNIEVSPLFIAIPYYLIFANSTNFENITLINVNTTILKLNGVNISSGGFIGLNAEINGLNICTFSEIQKVNGLSICGGILFANKFNGISISGINLINNCKGIQIGIFNKTENFAGVQIGLFNKTKKMKGLQLGLWNKNNKRTMPLLNW